MPNWMPITCQTAIRKMLCVRADLRASALEMLKDPWVNNGSQTLMKAYTADVYVAYICVRNLIVYYVWICIAYFVFQHIFIRKEDHFTLNFRCFAFISVYAMYI